MQELIIISAPIGDTYEEQEFSTTFWSDFTIAEHFGLPAMKDTFTRAFREWQKDVRYMADLVIVLNRKCWYWYNDAESRADGDAHKEISEHRSKVYAAMYHALNDWCHEHFEGEDARYYFEKTD